LLKSVISDLRSFDSFPFPNLYCFPAPYNINWFRIYSLVIVFNFAFTLRSYSIGIFPNINIMFRLYCVLV
jgi:hypothetical protein